ncbi:neuromedin-U receptor 1 [Biomphalaria pfeifferi]|uniref:Neuromedin-U receptor 1 n=1 Tax=Biomphalaria pfeifferi TaxID=112525 RepID=A0AAD8F8M4_BIOPF|nr:neuromedin-U receptor 1 [Biomphalaria pfeifferi]
MATTRGYALTVTLGIRPTSVNQPMGADPVSYTLLRFFDYFYYPVCFSLNVIGTLTNIANLVVFFRMGLKDVVNFSFFTLAVSDMLFSVAMAFVVYGGLVLTLAFPRELWAYDLVPFSFNFIFYTVIFKDTTVVITAYIAVARCCLVALPLQFKSIFTSGRTRGVLVTIVVVVTILHLPLYFTQGVAWAFDARTNTTRIYFWQVDARRYTLEYNDIVVKNIIPNTCIAIIIISLVVMSIKLSAASKSRKMMSNNANKQEEHDLEKKKSSSHQLSPKDIRVVKAVCSVAALYVFSTLPLVLQSIARLVIPEFNFGKSLKNTYNFVMVFSTTVGNFNSAFNFFLYFKYNTKFRHILLAGCTPPDTK